MSSRRFDDESNDDAAIRRRKPSRAKPGADRVRPSLNALDEGDWRGVTAPTTDSSWQRPPKPHAKPGRNQRLEGAIKARLESAGYEVMFRDNEIYVDGTAVGAGLRSKLVGYRGGGDVRRDDRVFARVVHRFLLDVLKRQARGHLLTVDGRLYVMRALDRPGFAIMKGQVPVAHVSATSFTTTSGEHRRGQFWAPGPHWPEAVELLMPRSQRQTNRFVPAVGTQAPIAPTDRRSLPRDAKTERQRRREVERPVADEERIATWPVDASPIVQMRANEASDQLRSHRVRADDFTVEIECRGLTVVTFQPVRRQKRTGRLDLPFELREASGVLRGLVHLKSPLTPLAISVVHRDEPVALGDAWSLVLEVAAGRYCAHPNDPSDSAEPPGFIPDGPTREFRTHWVSAHRARLPEGRRAGDDAVKAAEDVDIELPPGYTWRRGHFRGARGTEDGDRVLRFTWHREADAVKE